MEQNEYTALQELKAHPGYILFLGELKKLDAGFDREWLQMGDNHELIRGYRTMLREIYEDDKDTEPPIRSILTQMIENLSKKPVDRTDSGSRYSSV